jgi:hypothetical protein
MLHVTLNYYGTKMLARGTTGNVFLVLFLCVACSEALTPFRPAKPVFSFWY